MGEKIRKNCCGIYIRSHINLSGVIGTSRILFPVA